MLKAKILDWINEKPVHMALAALVVVVVLGLLVGLLKTVV